MPQNKTKSRSKTQIKSQTQHTAAEIETYSEQSRVGIGDSLRKIGENQRIMNSKVRFEQEGDFRRRVRKNPPLTTRREEGESGND